MILGEMQHYMHCHLIWLVSRHRFQFSGFVQKIPVVQFGSTKVHKMRLIWEVLANWS